MQWNIKSLFVLSMIFFSSLNARVIIPGDQTSPSFSFPIGEYSYINAIGSTGFLVAAANTLGGDYTLSLLRSQNAFVPLAPEKITLNEVEDVVNPFRGVVVAPLSFVSRNSRGLGLGDFAPVFCVSNGTTLYLIDQLQVADAISVITNTQPIVTGGETPAPTNGVVALNNALRGTFITALLGSAEGETIFGQGNSSLSLFLITDAQPDDTDNKNENGQTGEKEQESKKKGPLIKQQVTSLLNNTASVFKVANGSDIQILNNDIAFHWDRKINRLFIGIQGQGRTGGNDGIRSVAVARVQQENGSITALTIEQMAPNTLFAGQNKIIGGSGMVGGVGTTASVYNLATMHTSNTQSNSSQLGLSYLIVNGDIGDVDQAKRMVYALPLVCENKEENIIGTLASKTSAIENRSSSGDYPMRYAHCFSEQAASEQDLYLSDNDEDRKIILVGNGSTVGAIQNIQVVGDAVFASVPTSEESNQASGIFCSRALLDNRNAVKGWTDWQYVGNTFESAYGFAVNGSNGTVQYLTTDSEGIINTFKKTEWGNGAENQSADFFQALQDFPLGSGIEGFINYPSTIDGISGTDGTVALMMTMGHNKFILGQSGNNSSGVFLPTQGEVTIVSYQNGAISSVPSTGTNVIAIEGGALETIGNITAASINVSGSGRVFVGGINGLAVLVDSNGNGWDINAGIGNNFLNIPVSAFKMIGDYSVIKKLVSVQDYLYVLADQQLDRITISASNFEQGILEKVTLATSESGIGSVFNDIVVSAKMALLTTSLGLYRVGNGGNIMQAADETAIQWTQVEYPFGLTTMTKLKAVSYNNKPEFYSNERCGNVYVVSGNQGNNQGRVARYAVADTSSDEISDNTVQLLDDVYQTDVRQYFLNAGKLIQQFYSDGAVIFTGANKKYKNNAQVATSGGTNVVDVSDASNIINITNNRASGSQLVITNKSLLTNE